MCSDNCRTAPGGYIRPQADLFHFGGSAADHGNDGHSGSDGFVSFEQAFLDIPVERSIELGVSQLIFMVFVLGGDLLEPYTALSLALGVVPLSL